MMEVDLPAFCMLPHELLVLLITFFPKEAPKLLVLNTTISKFLTENKFVDAFDRSGAAECNDAMTQLLLVYVRRWFLDGNLNRIVSLIDCGVTCVNKQWISVREPSSRASHICWVFRRHFSEAIGENGLAQFVILPQSTLPFRVREVAFPNTYFFSDTGILRFQQMVKDNIFRSPHSVLKLLEESATNRRENWSFYVLPFSEAIGKNGWAQFVYHLKPFLGEHTQYPLFTEFITTLHTKWCSDVYFREPNIQTISQQLRTLDRPNGLRTAWRFLVESRQMELGRSYIAQQLEEPDLSFGEYWSFIFGEVDHQVRIQATEALLRRKISSRNLRHLLCSMITYMDLSDPTKWTGVTSRCIISLFQKYPRIKQPIPLMPSFLDVKFDFYDIILDFGAKFLGMYNIRKVINYPIPIKKTGLIVTRCQVSLPFSTCIYTLGTVDRLSYLVPDADMAECVSIKAFLTDFLRPGAYEPSTRRKNGATGDQPGVRRFIDIYNSVLQTMIFDEKTGISVAHLLNILHELQSLSLQYFKKFLKSKHPVLHTHLTQRGGFLLDRIEHGREIKNNYPQPLISAFLAWFYYWTRKHLMESREDRSTLFQVEETLGLLTASHFYTTSNFPF